MLGLAPVRSEAKTTQSLELARWEFKVSVDNWYHWEAAYHGSPVSMGCSGGKLRAKVDFSQDSDHASD